MSRRIIDTPVVRHAAADASRGALREVSEYGTAAVQGRQRTRRVGLTGVVLFLALGSPIGPPAATLRAQETFPQDAYQDPHVEALLARARAAKLRTVEGIDSYEGKLRAPPTPFSSAEARLSSTGRPERPLDTGSSGSARAKN